MMLRVHRDWRDECRICVAGTPHLLSMFPWVLLLLPGSHHPVIFLIGVLKARITCRAQRSNIVLCESFGCTYLILSPICFLRFLPSCADLVFPVLPALEWRHLHVCLPCLQQPLLFHSHLGSSHCWLLAGEIQVRTMAGHSLGNLTSSLSRKLPRTPNILSSRKQTKPNQTKNRKQQQQKNIHG